MRSYLLRKIDNLIINKPHGGLEFVIINNKQIIVALKTYNRLHFGLLFIICGGHVV